MTIKNGYPLIFALSILIHIALLIWGGRFYLYKNRSAAVKKPADVAVIRLLSVVEKAEPVVLPPPVAYRPPPVSTEKNEPTESVAAADESTGEQVSEQPSVPESVAFSAASGGNRAAVESPPQSVDFTALAAGAHTPSPHYPRLAKNRRLEGEVWLRIHIAADGSVFRTELVESSGHAVLDRAAEQTVLQQWYFAPTGRDSVVIVEKKFKFARRRVE